MSLEELIKACVENGRASDWEEFMQRFHSMIAAVVLRTASRLGDNSPPLVDDLVQETYLRICADRKRLLSEFTPHHPEAFYGYLKVITANVVHDHFRGERSQKRGREQTESLTEDAAPQVAARDETDPHRNILLQEIDHALGASVPTDEMKRDRAIFWLYYRYGLTASAIARLPSVDLTVKGVESVIHRLTRAVREKLREQDSAVS
jgi:RNA polymerase sigma-70 factor, ECF subfamily